MNILDLIYEFDVKLEFTGDNECDYNEMKINRIGLNEIKVCETYQLTSRELDDLDLGLRVLSEKIQKYQKREVF